MCGIVGYVGFRNAIPDVVLPGLARIEERGYDSLGLAACVSDSVRVVKRVYEPKLGSTAERLLRDESIAALRSARVAIGHTRWATHGGVSERNAHPHADCHQRIWVVHNGEIANDVTLRGRLQASGHVIRSETDTELMAHLIEEELTRTPSLEDAVRRALARIEGTYGIIVLDADTPDRLVIARLGSPVLIGLGENETFIASIEDAFAMHTKRVVELSDGEVCSITAGGYSGERRKEFVANVEEETTPAPHVHFMRKEIAEQPRIVQAALNFGGRLILSDGDAHLGGLHERRDELLSARHLRLVGCGSAYHAALYGAELLREYGGFDSVEALVASEARVDLFPPSTVVLGISQSGETFDTLEAIREAKRRRLSVFSIVNRVGKTLARETGCGIYTNAGREKAVASTKVFLAQGVVLALLALWYGRRRGLLPVRMGQDIGYALHALPHAIEVMLAQEDRIQAWAHSLSQAKDLFILGSGIGWPIALEAALKIKEVAYIHAEAFAAGEMKHGVIALIEKDVPVAGIVMNGDRRGRMETSLLEVQARGAKITRVMQPRPEEDVGADSQTIILPALHPVVSPLLAVIPFQLLAYELAVARDLDPDRPRHLAKSVTVA